LAAQLTWKLQLKMSKPPPQPIYRSLDDPAFVDESQPQTETTTPVPESRNSYAQELREKAEAALQEARDIIEKQECEDAKLIIEEIPAKCKQAALMKLRKANIMQLDADRDLIRAHTGHKLRGVGKIVFDACKDAGFNPRVRQAHFSQNYRHYIEISW
jgi:hypothetical protein